jgi:hypothetical protein
LPTTTSFERTRIGRCKRCNEAGYDDLSLRIHNDAGPSALRKR